jgi:outer membrane lipoprotein-sorting protein
MKKPRTGIIVFFFAAAAGVLRAQTGDEVLNRVEKALAGPKDYEGTADMVLADTGGGRKETRELRIWSAGKEKRVIKFLSPAGIRDIGLLSEAENSMYLYLPAQNRIRRIEGNLKNENFQGTDFTYDEMASYEWRKDYGVEIQAQDVSSYTLLLTKKKGSDKEYDELVMVVNKSDYTPTRMEMSEGGAVKKVLTISEVMKADDSFIPVKIRMEDLGRRHYTEMNLRDLTFNRDLESKDVFSKRFLKKSAR